MLWKKPMDHPVTNVQLVNSTHFLVPTSGYYFLYNRIQFGSIGVDVDSSVIVHGVWRIRNKFEEVIQSVTVGHANNGSMHTSMIQSVFHFREHDSLYVTVHPYDLVDDRREDSNYFGLFLVSL